MDAGSSRGKDAADGIGSLGKGYASAAAAKAELGAKLTGHHEYAK